MNIKECRERLFDHSKIRMPVWARETAPGVKISDLEDYMGTVAVARGDLGEAVLWADSVRIELEEKWEAIEGWEQIIGSGANKATGPQIMRAKAQIDRGTYDALRETKWVIAQLREQIRRLEKDEENASRRYTLITGS